MHKYSTLLTKHCSYGEWLRKWDNWAWGNGLNCWRSYGYEIIVGDGASQLI